VRAQRFSTKNRLVFDPSSVHLVRHAFCNQAGIVVVTTESRVNMNSNCTIQSHPLRSVSNVNHHTTIPTGSSEEAPSPQKDAPMQHRWLPQPRHQSKPGARADSIQTEGLWFWHVFQPRLRPEAWWHDADDGVASSGHWRRSCSSQAA
jgi:hypothetical protein